MTVQQREDNQFYGSKLKTKKERKKKQYENEGDSLISWYAELAESFPAENYIFLINPPDNRLGLWVYIVT